MSMNSQKNNDDPTDERSEFSTALKSLYAREIECSRLVDQAVRASIHDHFAIPAKRKFVGRRSWSLAAGIAAAVSVAAWLSWPGRPVRQPSSPVFAHQAPSDIDRNGTINVLDAFALARSLRDSSSTLSADINQDGRTDQGDVDAIANQAVSLKTGATS
jgi:hypothetical protein